MDRRQDTRDRIERIMHKRRVPILTLQLLLERWRIEDQQRGITRKAA